ncbi:hypothetical protein TVAG_302170 [Trichomonas vaginalis G3]|uniref:Right handed beta helix domain-containing protein n=1 Tax=Trichomonas vaginalis (strain ATCC PRA-98 / G3) TaxID=412133 RepID=A2EGP2_TRIV3|nr:hypothetical protein TVAGG3_0173170 [Trichomonas vaginalis G3]EAY08130.1 hypothetical protein TVAG_302170 [Trichomonas vaginalis G3]KAI5548739.1 hypothetical protein TVAGG3_0173170 [Trichomonas vaginalis G3]|eukprot:XP_001320353.1 hypothetical protein [Trichomonas vaginalis G3]
MSMLESLWESYIGTNLVGSYFINNHTRIDTAQNMQCFAFQCSFNTISNSAIYISKSDNTTLLHVKCLFQSCRNSGNGGSVYFYNSGTGPIFQIQFCASECNSNGDGIFVISNCRDSRSFEGTIFNSGDLSTGYGPITTWYDDVIAKSNNISYCKGVYSSGIFNEQSANLWNTSYCTYSSGIANQFGAVMCSGNAVVNSCNIINNSELLDSEGIVNNYARTLTISKCCLMNNNPNGVGKLFKVANSLIIISCYYDSYTFSGNSPTVQETTSKFINALSHLSTANCIAVIPFISQNEKHLETEERGSLHKGDVSELIFMAFMAY